MASNRDALAGIIAGSPGVGEYDGLLVAGRIARAGWRPPPRVIEDRWELDEMPVRTVVMHLDGQHPRVFRRWGAIAFGWVQAVAAAPDTRAQDIPLPVTVLYEPEEGQ